MNVKGAALAILLTCLIGGCEKVDLDADSQEKNGNNSQEQVVPISYGLGTQESPLLASQVLSGDGLSSSQYWVIGYVVGSTYQNMNNATFEAETTNVRNILLSMDYNCEDTKNCIPVELPTVGTQKALSLYHNNHLFRQCVMVLGQYGRYFNRNGIRNVQTGYWLPNFDLSNIKIAPTEWQEQNMSY